MGSSINRPVVRLRRIYETFFQWTLLLAVTGCCCARPERLVMPVIANPTHGASFSDWWHRCESDGEEPAHAFEVVRRRAIATGSTFQTALTLGEGAYALGERLHTEADDRCVDYWARTIAWMDEAIRINPHDGCQKKSAMTCCACQNPVCRAVRVKQGAMTRILTVGQRYGRLDPSSHLFIRGTAQTYRIPVYHQGFVWQPEDFNRLLAFEPPFDAPGNVRGLGVPIVVLTPGEPFARSQVTLCGRLFGANQAPEIQREKDCDSFIFPGTPFAATALIQLPVSLFADADDRCDQQSESLAGASVTLVNPLALGVNDGLGQIAQSPAMPLSFLQAGNQYDPVSAFINGNNGIDKAGLRFFEPFQADKIPLLFVHGLISDPTTFVEMADAVRADPVLRMRYQIWAFRYPTGEAFLRSAATLRQELAAAFACHANCQQEPRITDATDPTKRMVIVGHSMGGLVARMQIIDSGDRLWRSIANVPLEQLRGAPEAIDALRDAFFFEANPHVERVVYIATPHRGSPLASQCIGRLGGLLARKRSNERQEFDAFVAANPGAFLGELTDSLPSSVELLRPNSTLLQSLASLRSAPRVSVNSIIGDHYPLPFQGRSDGVVLVTSAFVREAESTTFIDASHTSIQRSIDAQNELLRILTLHLMTPTPTVSTTLL